MIFNHQENAHPYLRESLDLISAYDGRTPLHHHVNKVFREGRKYGSRDRKWIRHLTYSWFRLGFAFPALEPLQRLRAAAVIFHKVDDTFNTRVLGSWIELADTIRPEWTLQERVARVAEALNTDSGQLLVDFPEFSGTLDRQAYENAFLTQPSLWIRVAHGKCDQVKEALQENQVVFTEVPEDPSALKLMIGTDLESTDIIAKGWAEVQDISSQRTLKCMVAAEGQNWLDACAASGGKSLLLADRFPGVRISVSDVRSVMLERLDERFRRNKLAVANRFVHDFTQSSLPGYDAFFDGIIADVPCTGSGTWARTPERIKAFTRPEFEELVQRQSIMLQNIKPSIRLGGELVYITCSVFKAENEQQIEALCASRQFEHIESHLLQASAEGGDTLFCARLRRLI